MIKFHDQQDALRTILQIHERIKTQPEENLHIEGFKEQLDKVYGGLYPERNMVG